MRVDDQTKRFLLFLAGVLLACGAGWVVAARRLPARPLRIAIVNAPPFEYFDTAGQPAGFAVEVVSSAAMRSGIALEWVPGGPHPEDWLPSGKVDLWATLSVTEERKRQFYMTEPYIRNELCLIARARTGSPNEWTAASPDTRGRLVSVPDLPVRLKQARSLMPHARLMVNPTREGVAGDVCAGRAEFGLMEVRVAYSSALQRQPGCERQPLEILPLRDAVVPVALGAAPGAVRWANRLREEINAMAADGTLAPIYSRWLIGSGTNIEGFIDLSRGERRERLLAMAIALLSVLLFAAVYLAFRLRAERRSAERANAAKSQFLANMNHEMRTPLNGIIGMAQLLEGTALAEDQREYVATIESSSEVLLSLVNDVLDFSKIEAGKMVVEHTPFALHPLLGDCLQLLRQEAARKGLALELDADPLLPAHINGDPVRLRQILINLLSNAVKFTAAGYVRLSARPVTNQSGLRRLQFAVTDSGLGISLEAQARLFQAFTQADASTTRRYGGTGLGLAISKRLVELMGGVIGVESQAGVGSRFWLELPLVEAAAAPLAEAPRAARFQAHILLVEDNPVNQRVAVLLLQRFGCRVDLAENGLQAVEAAARQPFDAILMDCHMPEMDGYEATRTIRRGNGVNTSVPIIALTGNAVQGDRDACLASGMDDYLSKPIHLPALEAVLVRWLPERAAAKNELGSPVL